MKTFESCNRVWLTMPEDKQMPTGLKLCRGLTNAEMSGRVSYADDILFPKHINWQYWEGWYPVHADGTDDHETAAKFITEPAVSADLMAMAQFAEREVLGAQDSNQDKSADANWRNEPNLCPCSFPHQPHDLCDGSPASTRELPAQAPDFGEPWDFAEWNHGVNRNPGYGLLSESRHLNITVHTKEPDGFKDKNCTEKAKKDAARIIACVNALAGVADPAEFVRQAKENASRLADIERRQQAEAIMQNHLDSHL